MLGEIKCDEAHPELNRVLRNNQVHFWSLDLFTDKLRHINIFNSLFGQNSGLESGSAKPEVVRSMLLIGARRKAYKEKLWRERSYLVGHSLKAWLVVLRVLIL